ncbi:hypothetical protein [Halomarina rubra]|uniref:Solute:sodium symporter small subunit n=1 Tax=Halomarina rubra TaxID=2071873 RepID=A0ABD6AZI4_9EURY|nr:hypothetical protein [Halomarina rubra]
MNGEDDRRHPDQTIAGVGLLAFGLTVLFLAVPFYLDGVRDVIFGSDPLFAAYFIVVGTTAFFAVTFGMVVRMEQRAKMAERMAERRE